MIGDLSYVDALTVGIKNGQKVFPKGKYTFHSLKSSDYSNRNYEEMFYKDLVFEDGCEFTFYKNNGCHNQPIYKCKFGKGCTFTTPYLTYISCEFEPECKFLKEMYSEKFSASLEYCKLHDKCELHHTYLKNCEVGNQCEFIFSDVTSTDYEKTIGEQNLFNEGCTIQLNKISKNNHFKNGCTIHTDKIESGCVFEGKSIFNSFRPEFNEKLVIGETNKGKDDYKVLFVNSHNTFLCKTYFSNVIFSSPYQDFHEHTNFINCRLNESLIYDVIKVVLKLKYIDDIYSPIYNLTSIVGVMTDIELILFSTLHLESRGKNIYKFSSINTLKNRFTNDVNKKIIKTTIKYLKQLYKDKKESEKFDISI